MFALNEQHLMIKHAAQKLAQDEFAPQAAQIDQTEEYPWDNVKALVKHGYMGMTMSQAIWRPGVFLSRSRAGR